MLLDAGGGVLLYLPQPPAGGRQRPQVLNAQRPRRPEPFPRHGPVMPPACRTGRLQSLVVCHRPLTSIDHGRRVGRE